MGLRPEHRPKISPKPGKAVRPGRLRRRSPPPRVLLGAGIVLVVLGILAACYQAVSQAVRGGTEAPSEPQSTEAVPAVETKQVERLQVESRVSESKFPRAETARWIEQPIDHAKERARLLKRLEVDGRGPKFIPVVDLVMPADGESLACYCLLRTPLDALTEEDWSKAGMFRKENERASPYLRYVVIDNEQARRYLRDNPYVERVAYNLSPERE